jgi:hypothetical protein
MTDDVVRRRTWVGPVSEVVVCIASAYVMLATATNIKIDPLRRIGQVSGLSSLQLRYICVALPLIALLFAMSKLRDGKWFAQSSRLACAAFAGVSSGFVAGGVLVALRGTSWCLNANSGDMQNFVAFADLIAKGDAPGIPAFYPPLFPYVLGWYMKLTDQPGYYAMQDLQIAISALYGPAAYLSWRLLLRPGWALGVGALSALLLADPYKPASNLILIIMIPLLVRYLQALRYAPDRDPHQLVKAAVVYGVAFGLLLLMYSGWFQWCAPGVLVAGAIVFPWKAARWRGAIFVGVTLLVFMIVTWSYWTGVATYVAAEIKSGNSGPMVKDGYIYFDVYAPDPAYVAMWKGDLHGVVGNWPPHAELAGVGVYTLLLLTGLAIAITVGRKRTVVITLACVLAGAWGLRFWFGHYLWKTKMVGLYPRTTILIAYVLLVVAAFAAYYVSEYFARKSTVPKLRVNGLIGAVCALALFIGMAASSVADRYMPSESQPRGMGYLTFLAHEASKGPPP